MVGSYYGYANMSFSSSITFFIDNSHDHGDKVPFVPQQTYTIKPLPSYCTNHPNIGNLLIYKMFIVDHLWGTDVLLCAPKVQGAKYNDLNLMFS